MNSNLLLVSSHQGRLASWKQGVSDFVITASVIDRLDAIGTDVVKLNPRIVLLDFELLGLNGSDRLNRSKGAECLEKLCTETKVIVLSETMSEDMEWDLFKVGVRGCCKHDVQPGILNQVVSAIHQGELWMRRSLTSRLLDELGKKTSKNKIYRASLSLLETLTEREYDVAVRVGSGESNKQIAQSCEITERTVKAHLTEVYLKLGVSDRLHLALVLSADQRNLRRAANCDNDRSS